MTWSFFGRKRESKQQKPRRPHRALVPGRRLPHFESLEDRRMLAVLTVNSLLDTTVAADGLVTLREAIIASNTDTATDLGVVGSGADTIAFAPSLTGTITLGGTEIQITDAVTINGPGAANLTVSAAGASRIFNITNEVGDATIKGLTLTGGNVGAGFGGGAVFSNAFGLLTISDSVLTGNTADFGGAIYASSGLMVTNTTIGGIGALKNVATTAAGGGIFAYGSTTTTIKNSTISGNTAGGVGGGVYSGGTVNVENSTIGGTAVGAGNTAATDGGGIQAQTVSLLNSTVSGNKATAGKGGGVYTAVNTLLANSKITGNTSGGAGGGIFALGTVDLANSTVGGIAASDGNKASADGGGIYSKSNVTLLNSTVSGNQASGANADGGGIYDFFSAVTLKNSTVSGNKADQNGGGIFGHTVTLQNATVASNTADNDNNNTGIGGGVNATTMFKMTNSIVIGNSDTGGTNPDLKIPAGAASTARFSLIGDNTGLPAGAQFAVTGPGAQQPAATGNIIGQPATANAIPIASVLAPAGLADNGGPTPTIALLTGSVAINKGKNSLVVSPSTADQRGLPFVRIFGSAVDMGAFEFQVVAANVPPIVANPIPDQQAVVGSPFVFTFAANAFTDADGDVLTYTATLSPSGALPAWLTFTQGTVARTFVGVPTAADLGPITIRVTASDGKGGVVSDDFVLTVISNPPPTLTTPLVDQHAFVGVPFNFVVPANSFTDPNSDPLTLSATLTGGGALPAWLTFNPATGAFTGTPAIGDVGTVNVRVTATDPTGGTAFDDFAIVVANSELPFNENFEGPVDTRVSQKSPAFATTTSSPISGTTSYQATRPTVGSNPVATVDFANPATVTNLTNVSVDVSTLPGNGSSLWSNAVVVFDYQSPTNYKFAGVFEIINKLIIGQVVNGKVQYLAQKKFNATSNTTIPLSVSINHATRAVTLTSGGTSVGYTYAALGTGTVGIGTINANAKFDNLAIT